MLKKKELVSPIPGIKNLTYEDANTLLNFQSLWTEIIHWVRSFLHTVLGNLPEQRAIGNRLFRELPEHIYNEFSKYFNEEESRQVMNLMSSLILTNWRLITSYKNKDTMAVNLSIAEWYETANELAAFLATINKYYDKIQLRDLLYEYLRLKVSVMNAYLNGNHDLEMQIFDEIEDKVAQIANYMAMGIIAMRHSS